MDDEREGAHAICVLTLLSAFPLIFCLLPLACVREEKSDCVVVVVVAASILPLHRGQRELMEGRGAGGNQAKEERNERRQGRDFFVAATGSQSTRQGDGWRFISFASLFCSVLRYTLFLLLVL